jgi:hypothetical protein
MPQTTFSNPNVPHIQRPLAELGSLATVTESLRQGVESLGGHRGGPLDRAVTLQDLVILGLTTEAQIMAVLKN